MANSEKFVQPAIPRFDGHYDYWAMTMENFLRSREMWSLVEEGIPTMSVGSSPANDAQRRAVEEAKLKDLKVKNFLFQAIDREILETILDRGTSKAIWESMKRKYQGSTKVRRAQLQALKREFELLAMKEGEKIDTFLGRTLSVVNKMKINGESVEQSTIVSKILRSLTRKFNYVVCSIEESNDLSTLTIDELHGSLLVHEGRMQEPQEEEHVLNVSQDERPGYGRGRGSLRGGRGRGRGRTTLNKAFVECFKCHKLGHFQYECPDLEKMANYAEYSEGEDILLMAYTEIDVDNRGIWFLDSGCSNHMTGDKNWFMELDESFRHDVRLGNSSRIKAMGKGDVKFEVEGVTQIVSEVLFVPGLTNNLLSVGQLQEKGMAIQIDGGACKIIHPHKGLIVNTRMTANRMFIVPAIMKSGSNKCLKVEEEESAEENEIGGDGGASDEDGEALEAGKERDNCQDLSNDAENAEVCVKFAEEEEEWLEVMRCELQTIEKVGVCERMLVNE